MTLSLIAKLFLICAVLSAVATGLVLFWLRRRQILDNPNHRSSHTEPTPRGGGLAVVPVVAFAWIAAVVLGLAPWQTLVAVAAALGLAVLSWRDDRGGLPVLLRLGAQLAAIVIGLAFLRGNGHVFQGLLPPAVDFAVTAFLWLWFVNLYNFMDGIDGITGVETLSLGLGALAVTVAANDPNSGTAPLGLALAAAALGFLPWNWSPAKLFLGDVGSVPLGYLGGWLLVSLAADGHWAAALILPLYYLVDATVTLLRRLVRRERIWEAHREHFYQRAVQAGLGHGSVSLRILGANLVLIALASLAVFWPWPALVLAIVAVIAFLRVLGRPVRFAPRRTEEAKPEP